MLQLAHEVLPSLIVPRFGGISGPANRTASASPFAVPQTSTRYLVRPTWVHSALLIVVPKTAGGRSRDPVSLCPLSAAARRSASAAARLRSASACSAAARRSASAAA